MRNLCLDVTATDRHLNSPFRIFKKIFENENPSVIFLLLFSLSNFDDETNVVKGEPQEIVQDTTSARVWKQRAEEPEQYAHVQKKLAEKMAKEVLAQEEA